MVGAVGGVMGVGAEQMSGPVAQPGPPAAAPAVPVAVVAMLTVVPVAPVMSVVPVVCMVSVPVVHDAPLPFTGWLSGSLPPRWTRPPP